MDPCLPAKESSEGSSHRAARIKTNVLYVPGLTSLARSPSEEISEIIPPRLQQRYKRWLNGYPKPFFPEDPKTLEDLCRDEFVFREYTEQLKSQRLKELNYPEPLSKNMQTRLRSHEGWNNPQYHRNVLMWSGKSRLIKHKPSKPIPNTPPAPPPPVITVDGETNTESEVTHNTPPIVKCVIAFFVCMVLFGLAITTIKVIALAKQSPAQTNETMHTRNKRSTFISEGPNFPNVKDTCCRRTSNKLGKKILDKAVGWHEQLPGGPCKIAAVTIIIKSTPQNLSLCLSPNPTDPATKKKVHELKNQLPQTDKTNLRPKPNFRVAEQVAKGLDLSINEIVDPLPPWTDPSSVPHHFLLMHEFGKQQSQGKGDCWVCSHMHSGENIYPMLAKPIGLALLINQSYLTTGSITPSNKPFLIQGYSEPPRYCFLNGLYHDGNSEQFLNAGFCSQTKVNFTLLDIEGYFTDKTVDMKGLRTADIADADERMGNWSRYNLSMCPSYKPGYHKRNLADWMERVNKTEIKYNNTDPVHIAQWMCLVGFRSGQNNFDNIPAPHLPKGWIVCCGLWCHTTIPFPDDPSSWGWCTMVQLFPYMNAQSGREVQLVPAPGVLVFHKTDKVRRALTSTWEKFYMSMLGPTGVAMALIRLDAFERLIEKWINVTNIDIGLINEEMRKLRMEQEVIRQRQERLMMAVTGLCDQTNSKQICCIYFSNFTKNTKDIEVPDYYDIINRHQEEREQLQNELQNLPDSWNPFDSVEGWFGEFFSGIFGFFKKTGIVILMIVVFLLLLYCMLKFTVWGVGKSSKMVKQRVKKPSETALLQKAVWYKE